MFIIIIRSVYAWFLILAQNMWNKNNFPLGINKYPDSLEIDYNLNIYLYISINYTLCDMLCVSEAQTDANNKKKDLCTFQSGPRGPRPVFTDLYLQGSSSGL